MRLTKHMTFRRFGNSYHLRLRDGTDLEHIARLDEAHWVATCAPLHTLRMDPTFLKYVDVDADGSIRCFEMQIAVRWLNALLTDQTAVSVGNPTLALAHVNINHPQGKLIAQAMAKMLATCKPIDGQAAQSIGLDQIRQIKTQIQNQSVSSAGIVLPAAGKDEKLRTYIQDMILVTGGSQHPAGQMGANASHVHAFQAQINQYLAWYKQGQTSSQADTARLCRKTPDCGDGSAVGADDRPDACPTRGFPTEPSLFPLGDQTQAGYLLFESLRAKIDQYFAHCQAITFDPQLESQLLKGNSLDKSADLADPTAIENHIRQSPIARACANATLDFTSGINPYDASSLAQLNETVIAPLLGQRVTALSYAQWQQVKKALAAYQNWINNKPKTPIVSLDLDRLEHYQKTPYHKEILELIGQSNQTALVLDNICLAEKLVLYQANLLQLANNFVSFPDLYDPQRRAVFELGVLIMDGRRFDMAVAVKQRAQHAQLAKSSGMFVMYVQISGVSGSQADGSEIAVPVTCGGKGNLVVGKRGIFEHVDGKQYRACIVQMIENPISFSEALVAPFSRIGQLISGKIQQITGSAEKQLDTATSQTLVQVTEKPATPSAATAPLPPTQTNTTANTGMMAGSLLAGGGLAIAAMGSALTYMSEKISHSPMIILGGLGGAILMVLIPTAILAMVKLRKRDLSAILEGTGWAINARMRLTHAQSLHFTRTPRYPKGSYGLGGYKRWLLLGLLVALLVGAAIQWGWYRPY